MIKKLFSALVVVLFATSVLAQTGLTCNDPIPVDSNYVGSVSGPCELWYTAWTYDLPLNVHFVPANADSKYSPEVMVDFTCVPGYYADPKLDSLINLVDAYDVSFPIEFMCDYVKVDGKVEWDLSVNKSYREQLAEFGIPYNVQAFIKVTYFEAGQIRLKPDTAFSSCMETAEYVKYDDTLNIDATDAERVFVFPYADWQEDSIQFVWTGEEPAEIFLAVQECEFTPSTSNSYVWNNFVVTANAPYKMYSSEMKQAIKDQIGGGLFYAKVISKQPGKLVVEKIPMAAAAGGATLLEYGKSVTIAANDTNALFCFPRTWGATQFEAQSDFHFTLFASNESDFTPAISLAAYSSDAESNMRMVNLSNLEIANLVAQAKDDYVYVRFQCASAITITPNAWLASDCALESDRLLVNEYIYIVSGSGNDVYRLRYEDIKGYDLTIDWMGDGNVKPYIADACDYRLATNASVLVLKPAPTIKAWQSLTIAVTDIAAWESRVDADGYLYVRFNPTIEGSIALLTDKPVVEDPVLPSNPCVLGSTELKLNSTLNLNLASVHTIYRINYAEWQAAGATLAWEGASPLHTFLASTCTFPVAPHNRYVLDYEAVLPAGEKVMAADWLARMAQYVDEDGYLYVRFLTEFEGTLRVK